MFTAISVKSWVLEVAAKKTVQAFGGGEGVD